MKLLLDKQKTQENSITELKETLGLTHKEFKNLQQKILEKDLMIDRLSKLESDEIMKMKNELREQNLKAPTFQAQLSNSEQLSQELRKMVTQGNREIYNLKADIEQKEEVISLQESKIVKIKDLSQKQQQELLAKIKDLEETFRVKTILIEEKIAEIESLKSLKLQTQKEHNQIVEKLETQIRNVFSETESLEKKLGKSKDKIANKDNQIEELKNELASKTEELKEMQTEMDSGHIRKIEEQMNELEKRLRFSSEREKENQSKVKELLELVDELKNKLVERKKSFDFLKKENLEKEKVFNKNIDEKNSEIEGLKKQLFDALADVKVLVQEIEEKKKLAHANITKLCQIFN